MSNLERKRPKIDPYWEGEPHPLPETRKWIEDYRRYGSEPAPPAGELLDDRDYAEWVRDNPPPSLEALIDRAGRRKAAELGEEYVEDPVERLRKAPHQGGYPHITAEEWAEYDRAMVDWERRRKARLG